MKKYKIFCLLGLMTLMSQHTLAQENYVSVQSTEGDTTISLKNGVSIYFDEVNRAYINGQKYDNTLRAIDFHVTNPALPSVSYYKKYASYNGGGYAYDWGYGSVMHIREVLGEDMAIAQSNYNWYDYWSKNSYMSSRYVAAYFTWNYYYTHIAEINKQIAQLDREDAPSSYKPFLGALYAMRAHLYLDLAQMYECLPNEKVGTTNSDGNNVYGLTVPIIRDENIGTSAQHICVPRAQKADMVDFITSDLSLAEQYMADFNRPNKTLPDLSVVYGLQARLALWTGDYAQAAIQARKAINTGLYTPATQSEWLSTTEGFNTLSAPNWMWGMQVESDDDVAVSGICNWASWCSNEAQFGYAGEGAYNMIGSRLYGKISNSDFRKQSYWTGSEPVIDASYASGLPTYASLKFRPAQGNGTDYLVGALVAVPLMRVEEMYLIEAEAKAHTSLYEGKTLLQDFVCKYRDANYTCNATTLDELTEECLLQKRIELWGEGVTFFDYKRLNHYVNRTQNNNTTSNENFATKGRPAWMNFQIPDLAVNYNMALAGWNNPDYSGVYDLQTSTVDDSSLLGEDWDEQTHPDTSLPDINSTHQLQVPVAGVYDALPVDSILSLVTIESGQTDRPAGLAIMASLTSDMSDAAQVNNADSTVYAGRILNLLYDHQVALGQPTTIYLQSQFIYTAYDGTTQKSLSNVVPLQVVNSCWSSNRPTTFFGNMGLPTTAHFNYFGDDSFSELASYDQSDWRFHIGENTYGGLPTDKLYLARDIRYYFTLSEVQKGITAHIQRAITDSYVSYTQDNPITLTVTNAEDLFHGDGLFFNTSKDTIYAGDGESKVRLCLSRLIYNPAKTYQITCDNANVTVDPAEFDDYSSDIMVNVDISAIASTQGFVTLTLDAADALPGGKSTVVISIPGSGYGSWLLLGDAGTCTYSYSQFFSGDDSDLPIWFRQSYTDPNKRQFKIGNWGAGVALIMDATWNEQYQVWQISIPETFTGYPHSSYGDVMVADLATYQNYTTADDQWWNYPSYYDPNTGTFTLDVIYYVEAGYFGYGEETCQVDGFYVPDYSSQVSYTEVITDDSQATYACADLTLGADVAEAKAVVVAQSQDAATVADQLISGEITGTTVSAGQIQVPFDYAALGSSKLNIVVAATKADGTLGSYASSKFEYYNGENPWKSLGLGQYTEGIVYGFFQIDQLTYDVEILENEQEPGLYRLVDPYGDNWAYAEYNQSTPCEYLEINACDPEGVYILPQQIGVDLDGNELGYATYAGYVLSTGQADLETLKSYGYCGTLKDGVITFNTFQSGDDSTASDYYTFQGVVYYGDNAYYGGCDMKITLPSAGTKAQAPAAPASLRRPARIASRQARKVSLSKQAQASLRKLHTEPIQ